MLARDILLKDKIEICDKREAEILKSSIFRFIRLPTMIKRVLVPYLPKHRFQKTREELANIYTAKTIIRMDFIADVLNENDFGITTAAAKHLEKIRSQLLDKPAEESGRKWNIRKAAREVKLLKDEINNSNLDEPEKKELLEQLGKIRTVLSDEFENRGYKLQKIGNHFLETKTRYNERNGIYKGLFWFRQIHKSTTVLFTTLSLIGGILIIAGIFFPPLAPIAAIIMSVALVGLCYCLIALNSEKFGKWLADRLYFDLPVTKAQILTGAVCLVNIIIAVVYAAIGTSTVVPTPAATSAGISIFSNGLSIMYNAILVALGILYFYDFANIIRGIVSNGDHLIESKNGTPNPSSISTSSDNPQQSLRTSVPKKPYFSPVTTEKMPDTPTPVPTPYTVTKPYNE